jgi:hypothetical protein
MTDQGCITTGHGIIIRGCSGLLRKILWGFWEAMQISMPMFGMFLVGTQIRRVSLVSPGELQALE